MVVESNLSNNSVLSLNEINKAMTFINPLLIKTFIAIIILLLGFIIGKIMGRLLLKIFELVEFDLLIKRLFKIKNISKTLSLAVSYLINMVSLVMALNKLEITTAVITTIVIVVIIALLLIIVFGTNDIFANFFAGILLRFRKSINVGDNLRIKDSKKTIEGRVLSVGYLNMNLETVRKEIVHVPNMLLLKSIITKVKNLKK